ncbi:MAG: glycogen synthase GlgA [Betaproteobacteria bacterium]|nr:glycogen synthase GlgA [Betaproteobacteria bacterium]
MRVLFATPEIAPWVKSGGLGDVSRALPAALLAAGADPRVLIPYYPALRRAFPNAVPLASLHGFGGDYAAARLCEAVLPEGLKLWCIDCPPYYDRAGNAYQDDTGRDFADNAVRFGLLSRVAALLASAQSPMPWRPQVLHGNDWPCGLAPAFAHYDGGRHAAMLMAVHNLAFQGNFDLELLAPLGLPQEARAAEGVEYFGQLSFLKAGLQFARHIVTVSPRYAQELLSEEFGYGLAGLLRWRSADLTGILNGIDTALWNPQTDPLIAAPYGAENLEHKAANTRALRADLGLLPEPKVPLLGMVGRLTEQKGVDLVASLAEDIVQLPAQLVVLGEGDQGIEAALRELATRYAGRIAVQVGFDETLAHRIEAGADIFLMPSRFEPCGLNQMYSMHYGTPPVVRAVGGLADTVVDWNQATRAAGSATGFTFAAADASDLLPALRRAVALWQDRPAWQELMRNGMRRDFGWAPVARRYLELYARLAVN